MTASFIAGILSGHGTMNLFSALQNSCNIYFYNLGKKMDIDTIARYARLLGLGSDSGIDLPNENSGLVPDSAWKMNDVSPEVVPGRNHIGGHRPRQPECHPGANAQNDRHRGPARAHAEIAPAAANRKDRGEVVREFTPEFSRVPIAEENFELVIEGLFRVVNDEGTGRAAKMRRAGHMRQDGHCPRSLPRKTPATKH